MGFVGAGTWQTYIVKPEDVWHKVRDDVPLEYTATVTVNPLTALRMLLDFEKLNPGARSCPYLLAVHLCTIAIMSFMPWHPFFAIFR
jgi:hypothetical protein